MDFVKLFQQADEDDEDDEGLGDYEYTAEKRQKKRRKTEGDQPSSISSYHTQTLTQLGNWSSTAPEEPEDDDIFEVPSSPRSLGLRRKNKSIPSDILKSTTPGTSKRQNASRKMSHPCTPRKLVSQEIPSSQSPETPLSSHHSRASPTRRQPLNEKSTNSRIPFSINPKATSNRYSSPKLKMEAGFGSPKEAWPNHEPITPSKRSSPLKTVRFQVLEDTPNNNMASPTVKKEYSQARTSRKPSNYTSSILEILDSEAESESDIDHQEDEHVSPEEHIEIEQPETCYGDIGPETQMIVEGLITPHVEESQQSAHEELGRETQLMESQRLSTQHMISMAPRKADSDVFISMHPQHVTNILDQTKDHEFRPWRLPPTVSRIWIYETSPTCMLKYMAVIGPEKRPMEIRNEGGVGNVEFNAKPIDKPNYAYEILGLYELADPLSWAQLHANEWLKVPPTRWNWVRPAVLDRLTANLKPPLFIRSEPTEDIPASSSTDTAEAEAQLIHTMLQFSEPATHAETSSILPIEKSICLEELPLSTTPRQRSQTPGPSQASTASFNESQTPRSQYLADVIWESPTRPVPSSTPSLELPILTPQDYQGSDSILPYSLDSSELLTKSQMLPASLLHDSVPGPPLCIPDSDEEDD